MQSNTLRIPPDELHRITGKSRPSAQVRWFKLHYGVSLPTDEAGPVITASAFEGLVHRACGLEAKQEIRPKLRLMKKT